MRRNNLRFQGAMLPLEICVRSGKPAYDKRTAQTAANARYKESHVRLRIYDCHSCSGWHLTKSLELFT